MNFTSEYKKTEEYKNLYKMVKEMRPELQEYLVDLCIAYHKMSPSAYKNEYKEKKAKKNQIVEPSPPPRNEADYTLDAVKCYKSVEDAPSVTYLQPNVLPGMENAESIPLSPISE